jgi:hypothetical protein
MLNNALHARTHLKKMREGCQGPTQATLRKPCRKMAVNVNATSGEDTKRTLRVLRGKRLVPQRVVTPSHPRPREIPMVSICSLALQSDG